MPRMKLSAPHQLQLDEARRRISHLIAETRAQTGGKVSDVQESWNGNVNSFRFRTMGFDITGVLEVQPAAVVIELEFPFLALPFKGVVEREILQHARELLA